MADKNKMGEFYTRPKELGKWEGFKVFLWNSETSECLGRTGGSWGKLTSKIYQSFFFGKSFWSCYVRRKKHGRFCSTSEGKIDWNFRLRLLSSMKRKKTLAKILHQVKISSKYCEIIYLLCVKILRRPKISHICKTEGTNTRTEKRRINIKKGEKNKKSMRIRKSLG